MPLRRLLASLGLLLLLISCTHAANSFGRPDEAGERQAWWGSAFEPYVYAGCAPTVPSSSRTLAAFPCTAFVRGALADLAVVVQPAISLTVANVNGLHWIALYRDLTTVPAGWTKRDGSHYRFQQNAVRPADPTGGLVVLRVTVTGNVITAVESVANVNPVLSTRVGGGKNVKECGAKVDGITDDGAALNDCLVRFSSVVIPEGVLKSSLSTVLNPGNTLSGVGYGGNLNDLTRPGSILHYTGVGDAIVASYGTLTNCVCVLEKFAVVSPAAATGIHLHNIADFHIDRMVISGRLGPPDAATGNTTAAIWLDGGGGSGDQAMITTKITNSYISPNAGPGILGLGVNNTNAIQIEGNRIQGNTGIGIVTQSRARGWNIVGNDIEGNAGGGIKVNEKGEAWSISGNYIEANGSPWQIWLRMCSACHVTGNAIQGMGAGIANSAGILLGDTPGGGFVPQATTISNNQFQDVAMGVSIDAAWGVNIEFNSRQSTTPLEVGGTFLNVQSLNHVEGSILQDAVPGANPIETRTVTQGMSTTNTGPSNTATETTLYSGTILAHTLGHLSRYLGGFHFEGSGSMLQNTGGARDVTVRVKFAGVTMCTLVWSALPAGAIRGFTLKATVSPSASFALGRLLGSCEGDMGPLASADGTAVSLPSVRLMAVYPSSSATTVDVSINQAFVVTGQLSGAADVAFLMTLEKAHVTRLQY